MTSAKAIAQVFEYLGMNGEGKPVEVTRLNKLLYFSQGHALGEFGHALFSNQIDAWPHGPVVAVVYTGYDKIVQRAKKHGLSNIQLSPKELDLIIDVWEQYKGYNASQLSDMTHKDDSPWRKVYIEGEKNVHIPLELIERYFLQPENKLATREDKYLSLPTETCIPNDEYDPEEDAIWEAVLNEA